MSYIKAEDVLPDKLICQIQQYVDGAYIYIPRKPGNRHAWGQKTAYKGELRDRNRRILCDYAQGVSVSELCVKYHLSDKSIRRILRDR